MKLRSIVLAGVALAALTAPAAASDYMGWYLGFGIGYGYPELMDTSKVMPSGAKHVSYDPDALGFVTAGYKWDMNIRTEIELGYKGHATDHDIYQKQQMGGGVDIKSAMFNVNYDVPLWHHFTWTIGGGIGAGAMFQDTKWGGAQLIHGQRTGFMWQAMSGFSIPIMDSVDFFADYRFRSSEVDDDFTSAVVGSVHVNNLHENDGVIGIRWYMNPPPPPPPPPAPPPPPPPPPPPAPPPVKTFIVFFDFDKSNLTEKAQEVVAEAVKTAKSQGMVKVMVTGHTDTVGSDTYNQALSVRRAQSVKDEMVREGMTGDSISIEGKSFHDPLVPTGPGVREPQNRRAVIDLGG
jgi:OmpA-OmpF porin, OOP family